VNAGKPLNVAIVGVSGYSGAELVRLLARHPHVRLAALGANSEAGKPLSALYPALRGLDLPLMEKLEPADLQGRAEAAFLALPHTESMKAAPGLLAAGLKVIDLSGDFRLADRAQYQAFYKQEHTQADLLAEAVYGLCEIHGAKVAGARLVANPGCYTTTSILPLYPLLKAGWIGPDGLVIDAKSGVTGAGRKLSQATQFAEVDGNFSAYRVAGAHQHIPEIEQELSAAAGQGVTVTFTPHLLPINRGILVTSYGMMAKAGTEEHLQACLADFYRGKPFARVLQGAELPTLRAVVGTNLIEMAVRLDARSRRVLVFSTTDNLIKGAAGQAVQNLNLMMGWPETAGLDLIAQPV
jgi:N-acetyl-gamma-glutamyl-phosphate reductase